MSLNTMSPIDAVDEVAIVAKVLWSALSKYSDVGPAAPMDSVRVV